jgi:type II secretory pathway pseudopilin PulG
MLARVRSRLASERGFTIVEAVITVALTLMVCGVGLSVLDRAYSNNDAIQRKSEAQAQGRQAIDAATRLLRSQVCANSSTPPIASANGTSITFYAAFDDGEPTDIPERHTLTLDPSTSRLIDTRVAGAGTADAPTYTGTASSRVLAYNVTPVTGTNVFQYFGYTTATPPAATVALNSVAAPTLSSSNYAKVARIVITLRANPPGRVTGTKNTTTLQDEVYVRLANPNDNVSTDTTCV